MYLECHLPVILPTLYQSPHEGQGQSKSPPLLLLWLLPPYSQKGVTGRVGKPGKEGGGAWGEGAQGPPEGSVEHRPSLPSLSSFTEAAAALGDPRRRGRPGPRQDLGS